ncbi:TonB-dependent siderophore receptor [Agrobacterium tumefaciens]|uniref:TonB-dependent receptor n=1 Tax=Agrobacterium tumefaciens TaxID=358 RepID=UPI00287BD804|nr:TonB-dependent siderophore receptor [Agrobacterium tumefaciens]MDS7594628.1 TonB-dependent siderophore receptor [Agrobacterium tumefaciens]
MLRGNFHNGVLRHSKAVLAGVSLLAMSSVLAHGQEANRNAQASSASDTRLETIVVTGGADKRPPATGTVGQPPEPYAGNQVAKGARLGALGNRSVLETPFSIAAYTAQLIRDQQARTIADITLNDPSVRQDAPAYSERDSFFIRGFSVVNLDVLYDGLPYIANPRRGFLEGIERVEVLKGPTAFVNGGVGRVGGTINLVPKRATDEPLTRLTTSYISDSQLWNHADIGRRFGPAGEWGIRANGSYRFGETGMDHNEIEVGVASLGIDYRGENVRASLDLNHSTQNIDAPTSLFNSASSGIAIPEAPKGRINTANPFEYHDSTHNMAAARIEYDILDTTTIYAAAGASRYREDFLTSSYKILNANGDATSELAIQPQQIQGFSGEIGLRSEFETGFIGHELNVSVQRSLNENYRGGFLPGALGLPAAYATNIYNPIYLPDNSVNTAALPRSNNLPLFADLLSTSVAISDTLSFFDDRMELTLGGRYQEVRSRGFNTRPGATPIGQQNYFYEETRFSPAVAANWRVTDDLSIYANYVEALSEGGIAPATAKNRNEVFPPFVHDQKEVGAKYDLGSFAITAALFEIRQKSAYTDPVTQIYSVDGLQINRGVELSMFGEPMDGLRLLGGVTFMNAELDRTLSGTFNGNRVPGVPKTTISVYGEYDLPWVEGLTMTGRVLYNGSTLYDQANKQKIDDWTRVDLGGRYKFNRENGKAVEIRANVENVFNENYWASSARGFLAAGASRTFMLSASFDF